MKVFSIINITPWGTSTLPTFFTDRQKAYNYLHELQIRFPNEVYKVKES